MEIRFPPPRSRANLTATEAPMTITTCIFDAYGTLFDVNAAAREVAAEPGQEQLAALWPDLARDWRRKQLEYSWLRTIAGRFIDFWEVTQDSLDWAMDAHGLHDAALRARLLAVYKELPAYPEVPEMLRALKEAGKIVQSEQAPKDAFNQAEGYRYLARLLRGGLESFLEFRDPMFPQLRCGAHETIKLGADNPDNRYESAPINPK